jgi:hypothetical protein
MSPVECTSALVNMQCTIIAESRKKPRAHMYTMMPDLMMYCKIDSTTFDLKAGLLDDVSQWDIAKLVICTYVCVVIPFTARELIRCQCTHPQVSSTTVWSTADRTWPLIRTMQPRMKRFARPICIITKKKYKSFLYARVKGCATTIGQDTLRSRAHVSIYNTTNVFHLAKTNTSQIQSVHNRAMHSS